MQNNKKETLKNGTKKSMEKSLMTIADIFATLPCGGPWFEVKVPQKLQNK